MKKLLAIICSVVLSLGLLAACGNNSGGGTSTEQTPLEKIKAAGVLKVGTSPDYAPFEFEDPNKSGQDAIVGADIELAKAIAEEIGVKLEIVSMDFDSLIVGVQQGKIDMSLSGFTWKDERVGQVAFAGPFYTEGGQGLMVLKENVDKYKSLSDFDGKKIAAQSGSVQLGLVETQIKDAQIQQVTTIPDGIMMLQSGKVDALAIAGVPAQAYTDNYDNLVMSSILFDVENPGLYALLNVNHDKSDFQTLVQKVIDKVESDGSYSKWVDEAKALADSLGLDTE